MRAEQVASPAGTRSQRQPIVIAVLVAWNSGETLSQAIASALASPRPPDQVIVVDNASTDNAVAGAARAFPGLVTLRCERNLGFAGGANQGIRHALTLGADFVWLLNDDVLVAPETLPALLAVAAAEPMAGLLGPLVCQREAPELALSAGGALRDGWFPLSLELGRPRAEIAPTVAPVEYLSGCALLASRPFIEKAGLLDEDYFMYQEDVDWADRARAAGFGVLAVRGALAWHPDTHRRDDESPRVTYYVARNGLLFLRRRRGRGPAYWRAAARHLRTLVSWSVQPRWRYRRAQRNALARALADAARGHSGPADI
jgi:GT2 family glycosyltransferase